ncbi:MAG: hypothetical protein H7Y11_15575, partial [Armatimonadetes bacterium]|nr:hypothetical protein [Anaerolineae bacterium]
MRNLQTMLRDADAALLPILAKRWGVAAGKASSEDVIAGLLTAMLDPARAEKVYDALNDEQRGALQTLNGFKNRAMPAMMFERMFGEVRLMGAGKLEREKPHENPTSLAEALYYRGLVGKANDKVGGGIGPVFYIPDDLAQALPTRKTGYSAAALESLPGGDAPEAGFAPTGATSVQVLPLEDVENIRQADTSIVDDMTTLLAYLQLYAPTVDADYTLDEALLPGLQAHLLVTDAHRAQFLIAVGITAELVEVQAGKVYPRRAEARRWLAEKRAPQLKWLADAWLT